MAPAFRSRSSAALPPILLSWDSSRLLGRPPRRWDWRPLVDGAPGEKRFVAGELVPRLFFTCGLDLLATCAGACRCRMDETTRFGEAPAWCISPTGRILLVN